VEKDKIAAHNLPPRPRCRVDSAFFKLHAYRERRFLVIVDMTVRSGLCTLVRFSCPGCGKTFTYYPDFSLFHKHYTCTSMMGFTGTYVESDDTTYKQTIMVDGSAPGYPGGERTLAPSTIHRWFTILGGLVETCQKALSFLLQEDPLSRVSGTWPNGSSPAESTKPCSERNGFWPAADSVCAGHVFRPPLKPRFSPSWQSAAPSADVASPPNTQNGGDHLDKKEEKRAIFWCDPVSPVIYGEIEPESTNQFLKQMADQQIRFPDGRTGKPALSTLRRKLNRYRQGGFDGLARQRRRDRRF
jgi:hypothetical protein